MLYHFYFRKAVHKGVDFSLCQLPGMDHRGVVHFIQAIILASLHTMLCAFIRNIKLTGNKSQPHKYASHMLIIHSNRPGVHCISTTFFLRLIYNYTTITGAHLTKPVCLEQRLSHKPCNSRGRGVDPELLPSPAILMRTHYENMPMQSIYRDF